MKKNFKKFISILLSLLMLMSVMSVGAFAEDVTPAENTAEEPAPEENHEHRNFYQVMLDFFTEFVSFLKYIFYDVFRGEPA